jgi:hypothetical protein
MEPDATTSATSCLWLRHWSFISSPRPWSVVMMNVVVYYYTLVEIGNIPEIFVDETTTVLMA